MTRKYASIVISSLHTSNNIGQAQQSDSITGSTVTEHPLELQAFNCVCVFHTVVILGQAMSVHKWECFARCFDAC
jgi:hypothetical protein